MGSSQNAWVRYSLSHAFDPLSSLRGVFSSSILSRRLWLHSSIDIDITTCLSVLLKPYVIDREKGMLLDTVRWFATFSDKGHEAQEKNEESAMPANLHLASVHKDPYSRDRLVPRSPIMHPAPYALDLEIQVDKTFYLSVTVASRLTKTT